MNRPFLKYNRHSRRGLSLEDAEEYKLHRLIGTLLSESMTAEKRLDIVEKEYGIKTKNAIGRNVNDMCNLSDGLIERGIEKGMEQGIKIGEERGIKQGRQEGERKARADVYKRLLDKGYSAEELAESMDCTVDEIRKIIESSDKTA